MRDRQTETETETETETVRDRDRERDRDRQRERDREREKRNPQSTSQPKRKTFHIGNTGAPVLKFACFSHHHTPLEKSRFQKNLRRLLLPWHVDWYEGDSQTKPRQRKLQMRDLHTIPEFIYVSKMGITFIVGGVIRLGDQTLSLNFALTDSKESDNCKEAHIFRHIRPLHAQLQMQAQHTW